MFKLLLAFGVSWFATLLAIRSAVRFAHLTNDVDLDGVQKMHAKPVPRIGGASVFAGCVASVFAIALQDGWGQQGLVLMLTALPAFGIGFVEDLTKRVSPRRRLAATALSAILAGYFLDALLSHSGVGWLDDVMSFAPAAWALTVFTIAGVANSVNIIDGINGLASMCVVIILAGMGFVGWQVQDVLVYQLALVGIGAVLGFFAWNFPSGRIFLGDGGAYFLGFYVAEVGILLIARNPSVSPMFALLVCGYPVFETVFSIYRRVVVRRRAASQPDAIHLHSLVFRRLVRRQACGTDPSALAHRNSMAAPYLWVVCSAAVVPAVLFWRSTDMLLWSLLAFCVAYVLFYTCIVRFRTPRWLIVGN
jgi:UDP-N-acetylmuramyl pentapeptide phosphotransferase/UDP-N-acetylglucosamine-1-phosphate transferase